LARTGRTSVLRRPRRALRSLASDSKLPCAQSRSLATRKLPHLRCSSGLTASSRWMSSTSSKLAWRARAQLEAARQQVQSRKLLIRFLQKQIRGHPQSNVSAHPDVDVRRREGWPEKKSGALSAPSASRKLRVRTPNNHLVAHCSKTCTRQRSRPQQRRRSWSRWQRRHDHRA